MSKDPDLPAAAKMNTLARRTDRKTVLWVTAQEDADHYKDRDPGPGNDHGKTYVKDNV
jgi:hypothetical protein